MNNQLIKKNTIFTIGHSNRDLAVFIAMLESFGVDQIVDVRQIPWSRHNPQFNFDTFPKALRSKKIGYRHEKDLGGLRKVHKDSINDAWINLSFRAFADYMQQDSFSLAIDRIIARAQKKTLALMCAEALPYKCHRSLIGDALVVRGMEVFDIYNIHTYKAHILTPWAKVQGIRITYPST